MVSSLAHNTMAVDNLGQKRRGNTATYSVDAPLEHPWRVGDDTVYLRATYDDGYGPDAALRVAHTRSFIFVDERYWVIVDRVQPADDAEHLYEVLFMLSADSVTSADTTITCTREAGPGLMLAASPVEGQSVDVVEGRLDPVRRGWRRGGDDVEPNPTAAIAQTKAGPATFVTVLYPQPAGVDPAQIEVRIIEDAGTALTVSVRTPDSGETRITEDLVDDVVSVTRPG
jgi:hypothetical protein